jgi:cytochrome d ubiquinol oxidase subunit II
MMSIFPLLWAAIIAFCILMYVTLDGFTLGTGILFPFLNKEERHLALSMILPTWDGNQTWLVLGAASLYGAFPLAFGIILPIFYLPLLIMVIALLFRGVAFEFRLKASEKGVLVWDTFFSLASLITTLIQGIVLGAFIQGFDLTKGTYSSFGWASWYACFTGISLVFGYTLLGSTRLILKTEGPVQQKAYRFAKIIAIIIIILALGISLWTPFVDPYLFTRWFKPENLWILILMPVLTLVSWVLLLSSLQKKAEKIPYYMSIIIFCCCYVGFLIGIWPNIVPHTITIWDAAAPTISLKFMLVGAIIMIPLLLIYTGYSYKIFSGKVKDVIHY